MGFSGVCVSCGRTSQVSIDAVECGFCSGPLTLRRPTLSVDDLPIGQHVAGVWRYARWLPSVSTVSIGEPMTPLLDAPDLGRRVHLKLDSLLPTGSFKDRGSSVVAGWLHATETSSVITDSSGNAGASLTAYATSIGVKCRVFMPAGTSDAKVRQVQILGGEVTIVEGDRRAAETAAKLESSSSAPYIAHSRNPFFIEGARTWAFEVWEQLERKAPAAVVLPVGAGTLAVGCYLGFFDLHAAGLIDSMPRILGVQSEACSPLVDAFHEHPERFDEAAQPGSPKPFAEGIAISRPVRKAQILESVRATNGDLIRVSDNDIREAIRRLTSRGVLVEPSGAVAAAGLARAGAIESASEGSIVVAVTGHGWKDFSGVEMSVRLREDK